MKLLIKYVITSIYIVLFNYCYSQAPLTIDLPVNGGSLIGEVLHADGKIFAYASDGISVFEFDEEAGEFNLSAKIPFSTAHDYGKFNPVYYHETFGAPDQTMMAYNENLTNKYLYALAPDLKLLVIDADALTSETIELPVEFGNEPDVLNDILDSQSEAVVMKYDENNDRLYFLVSARNPDTEVNPIGNFHRQITVFAVYEVSPNIDPNIEGHLALLYREINAPISDEDSSYGEQVVNYVYNERNDFFYLLRLGTHTPSQAIVEVRDFGSSFVHTIELVNVGGSGYYKMGKMLYINDQGSDPDVHKILVFPLRFFTNDDDNVPIPGFHVIDGTNYTVVDFVNYNEQVIRDATFLEGHDDLILSFAPETNGGTDNESMAVFSYNQDPEDEEEYNFELKQELPADNSIITSAYDLNVALRLTNINSTSALVSNKDGIGILEYNASEDNYSHTNILNAEGNFFRKGAVLVSETDPMVFIPNTVANGIEIYDIDNAAFGDNIRTGYPVYYITANEDGSNLYLYNKLNAHETGLYSYRQSLNDPISHIDFDAAIGDVVYNPYQDHFLVTKFEPGNTAEIEVYDASTNTMLTDELIELTGVEFAKEVFISPNGKIYICTDMSTNQNPTIYVLDAYDYSVIKSFTLSNFPEYLYWDVELGESIPLPTVYYNAHFAYNAYDESVSISVAMQDPKLLPYNSQASTIFNIREGINPPIPPPPGKLVVDKNDIISQINLNHYPGKIVVPDNGIANVESQFHGKMYIIGEGFYEYDYLADPLPGEEDDILIEPEEGESYFFINLVYSPYHDKLFAIQEDIGTNAEHRTYKIWTIFYNESGLQIVPILGMTRDGQIAAIFYNPYDKRIYVYQKVDEEKLGTEQVKLLSFDPGLAEPTWSNIDLGISTYFPDYDHTRDKANLYYNNMITPYISPSTNQIYVPNGGHSCVSKVPFTAREPLLLIEDDKNWAWVSFPRLQRTGGDPSVDAVIGGENIVPQGYNNDSELRNKPIGQPNGIYSQYKTSYEEWRPTGLLSDIKSEFGYKLKLLYDDEPEQTWVLLSGEVLPPNYMIEDFDIDARYENWVGYWLYQVQSPFDAIADEDLDKLTAIRAVDWCCYKQWDSFKDNQEPWWLCGIFTGQNAAVALNYGDMVILESNYDIDNFQWQNYGNPPEKQDLPHTEYYQYEDQADYTAFFIELDTINKPQEIGAFVGDTCVGATTVLPEDTIVLVPGYTEGMNGEVVFEEYYGSEKQGAKTKREYLVNKIHTDEWYRRTVHSNEGQGHYLISFREKEETVIIKNNYTFSIYPNPALTSLTCKFDLDQEKHIEIQLVDITGKIVRTCLNETLTKGDHTFQVDLKDNAGQQLKPGIYFVQYRTDNVLETKKLIVK